MIHQSIYRKLILGYKTEEGALCVVMWKSLHENSQIQHTNG